MSQELRVLVEVRATRTREQTATELPGFVVNLMCPPEAIRPDDNAWRENGFRIHGTVPSEALDRLRQHADVLDVYLDTEVICSDEFLGFVKG